MTEEELPNVICPDCGAEQSDMGRNVLCEECDGGPMPFHDLEGNLCD